MDDGENNIKGEGEGDNSGKSACMAESWASENEQGLSPQLMLVEGESEGGVKGVSMFADWSMSICGMIWSSMPKSPDMAKGVGRGLIFNSSTCEDC
jgi:hypothetical protein